VQDVIAQAAFALHIQPSIMRHPPAVSHPSPPSHSSSDAFMESPHVDEQECLSYTFVVAPGICVCVYAHTYIRRNKRTVSKDQPKKHMETHSNTFQQDFRTPNAAKAAFNTTNA
jgi:hypothetical protein